MMRRGAKRKKENFFIVGLRVDFKIFNRSDYDLQSTIYDPAFMYWMYRGPLKFWSPCLGDIGLDEEC